MTDSPAGTATAVCPECRSAEGTLHAKLCPLAVSDEHYVQHDEAVPVSELSSAATAVLTLLNGGLVPTAGEPDPLRRVELAAIWFAEATAELNDALLTADANGVSLGDLGRVLKMTPEGVRQRLVRLRKLEKHVPGT